MIHEEPREWRRHDDLPHTGKVTTTPRKALSGPLTRKSRNPLVAILMALFRL